LPRVAARRQRIRAQGHHRVDPWLEEKGLGHGGQTAGQERRTLAPARCAGARGAAPDRVALGQGPFGGPGQRPRRRPGQPRCPLTSLASVERSQCRDRLHEYRWDQRKLRGEFMAKPSLTATVAVAGLVVAALGAWWWQQRPASAPQAAQAAGAPAAGGAGGLASVEVTQVRTVRLQDDAQAVGSLRSRQSVTLKPETAGRVSRIAFADGARVRRGQLLVQLDDTLQRAALSQAQAQQSIARANLRRHEEPLATPER